MHRLNCAYPLRGDTSRLLTLHGLPLDEDPANNCQASHCDSDVPGFCEGGIVCLPDTREEVLRNLVLKTRRTDVQDNRRINVRNILRNLHHKTVIKDILSNRDEESTTEGLHEHNKRSASGSIF